MNIYSIKNKGVAGNIWKFAILYITNKRPYMTFLTIFLLLMPNTTAQTIGLLTAIGQIVGVIFEVPSGYISDRIGHKNALVIAKICYLLSTLCYVFATSKIYFFIAAILFAIGISMLSGTTSTYLKESLDHLGQSGEYSQVSGRLRSFGFAVPIILILLVSFVAEQNYQLAFAIVAVIDVIGLAVALLLYPVPKEQVIDEFDHGNFTSILKEYVSFGWLPYVIMMELLVGLTFGATMGFKNPFQESIGLTIGVIGILWSLSRLGISGILLLSGWLKKHIHFKQLIVLQGSVFTLSLLLAGFAGNKWLVAFGFILATASMWGLSVVKSHFYLEHIGKSQNRVTMLSINAFIQKIVIGITGFGMGLLVSQYEYAYSYVIMGSIVMLITILAIILLKNKKQLE